MSDLAHERLQVLDFEQSIYKPERGFHESGALEQGYIGIIVGCTVQRIRSFWRFEGRERAGLRFWEGQLLPQSRLNRADTNPYSAQRRLCPSVRRMLNRYWKYTELPWGTASRGMA